MNSCEARLGGIEWIRNDYIRIKTVIDNPHLTDSYFVSRLDEFSNVWLDRVLDTEWKWLRFEWQARGIIHCSCKGCSAFLHPLER